jgi:adenylate kinase
MDAGKLVSDDIVIGLVKERISQPDCQRGFLMDGFPRNIPQAEALKNNHIHLDFVIEIRVPDAELINRLSGRRIHPASGRIYHTTFNPPRVAGVDDETGEPLIQRVDDQEDTVRHRLSIYHQQTEPLVNYYRDAAKRNDPHAPVYVLIDGTESVEAVRDHLFEALAKATSTH